RGHAVREPALAGRHADKLRDDPPTLTADEGTRRHQLQRGGGIRPHEKRTATDAPRARQALAYARRNPRYGQGAVGHLDRRYQEGTPGRRRSTQIGSPRRGDPRYELRSR